MNSLVEINNNDLETKEFKGQRVITFKEIDLVHERVEGTAKRNFNSNKSRFIENVDYFFVKPSDVEAYEIRTSEINNAGTYLITESGYLMLVKSLSDNLAWMVQRELVNKYFRVKDGQPNLEGLSPQLQALINLELNQKKLEEKINLVREENKEEIEAMRSAITLDSNGWRKETTAIINKIANKLGGFSSVNLLKREIYKLLDTRLGVDVNRRLLEKQKRMALEGVCKSKINKTNVLDVIAEDKKLIDGYVNIIRQYALKYGV